MSKDQENYNGLEIAVVGVDCNFPSAESKDKFWQLLKNAECALSFYSDEELQSNKISKQLVDNPKYVGSKGGFLQNKGLFDPSYFGYSEKEAELMDPQVRLFHESVVKSLEDAGEYNNKKKLIGLFGSASNSSFWETLSMISGKSQEVGGLFMSQQLASNEYLCTRISHNLNFIGPSVFVHSACSSSLVAIHLAVQALLNGECDLAIAGGVSVTHEKTSGYVYNEGMILSKDGYCRAFDINSSGTVFGNGVGTVVLKPLQEAMDDNNNIYAIIKGSAINNDGSRKLAFSAPSLDGQAGVIKIAQQVAEVDPESISFIEAHGTGTELGDSIEIEGLRKAFSTNKKNYCAIGSVKTNLGHLDTAAGVASFIKTVLALKYGKIPANVNFSEPNPILKIQSSPFYINNKTIDWATNDNKRRAGVSSFGIGGTNAHIVLEEYDNTKEKKPDKPFHSICLSAKTKSALLNTANDFRNFVMNNEDLRISDTAYTLHTGRKQHKYRISLVCDSVKDLTHKLENIQANADVNSTIKPYVVFMFAGQGSQYENMCKDLYLFDLKFQEEFDKCFNQLKEISGKDYTQIVFQDSERDQQINNTANSQPILFTIEYVLANYLMSLGIKPDILIGHSLGEYVAACISGVFSFNDALKLIIKRAELMHKLPEGDMLSISYSDNFDYNKIINEKVSLASINSPNNIVVSGERFDIESTVSYLDNNFPNVKYKRLHTSHAFHSYMLNPILEEFRDFVNSNIKFKEPTIPVISNLTGDAIGDDLLKADYWSSHIRNTVQFCKGLQSINEHNNAIFIEIGPGNSLSNFAGQIVKNNKVNIISTVRHPQNEISDYEYFLNALNKIWQNGVDVVWDNLYYNTDNSKVSVTTYHFDNKTYWIVPEKLNFEVFNEFLMGNDIDIKALNNDVSIVENNSSPKTSKIILDNVELFLLKEWKSVLGGIEEIGATENFFDIGGDSLRAYTIVSKINSKFGIAISLKDFFKYSTIQSLSDHINNQGASQESEIQTAGVKDYYIASSQQRRMYFLQQFDLQNVSYNIPQIYKIVGKIDFQKLRQSILKVVDRHEALRTSYSIIDNDVVQKIHEELPKDLEVLEISEQTIDPIQIITPFNLSALPLFKCSLIKINPDEYLFVLNIHHIISDGITNGIILREIIDVYSDSKLSPIKYQYKDYSEWQIKQRTTSSYSDQKKYWLNQFKDEVPVLNLPADYPRPKIKSFEGKLFDFTFNKELTAKIDSIAKSEQVTLFMLLISIFNVLLSKLSQQEEIIVGTPASGRSKDSLLGTCGMFVNTIVLFNNVKESQSFSEFLQNVKKSFIDAFDNQDFQYEALVNELKVERDTSRNPLFDVMFVMQNTNIYQTNTAQKSNLDFNISYVKPASISAQFDLKLDAQQVEDEIHFSFEYCSALFNEATINQFIFYFTHIAEQIVENPSQKIQDVSLTTAAYLTACLGKVNDTSAYYPKDKSVIQIFEEQAKLYPAEVALCFDGRTMTYEEFNSKVNQLARYLIKQGVTSNSIVGIISYRSFEMIIGIYAVLKVCGVYLPIDPNNPNKRIEYILDDSNADIILCHEDCMNLISERYNLINLSDQKIYNEESTNLNVYHSPNEPVYVIYTSGSTGVPKGVIVESHALVNRLNWMKKEYNITELDNLLLKTPYTFDVSVWEIFLWSFSGSKLTILQPELEKDPFQIINTILSNKVTIIHFVPSMLEVFLGAVSNSFDRVEKLKTLRHVISSGEELKYSTVTDFNNSLYKENGTKLENLYGPTEATIDVSYYNCSPYNGKYNIPIGSSIDNISLYIIDKYGNPLPENIIGELCIAGVGLATGYLNKCPLTDEKFVYNKQVNQRIYRTGDLARINLEGKILFEGRIDHQVKIRGNRIELEEIEHMLCEFEAILSAKVVVDKENNNTLLNAYYISESILNDNDIANHLRLKLPEYMVPDNFIHITNFPLTSNGKLDRKKLPKPTIKSIEFEGPKSNIEKELIELWAEVLGLEQQKIGVHSNFFDIGGNSISMIKLQTLIDKKYKKTIPVVDLFNNANIKAIANYLGNTNNLKSDTLSESEVLESLNILETTSNLFNTNL